jgi:hypothetical protein
MNWYVLHVKHNLEDTTALQLRNASIEVLNRIKKYIRGKYLRVIEPLSPGYLFALFDAEVYGQMIKYARGVKFIVDKQSPLVVPEELSRRSGRGSFSKHSTVSWKSKVSRSGRHKNPKSAAGRTCTFVKET